MAKTKKTILAVDDNVASLSIIKNILEGLFNVCLAKSASVALSVLQANNIDLILLDMDMPGVSGMDLLTNLKNDPAYYHIPVIFVTSHASQEVIRNVIEAGARGFVVKPINTKSLFEKINKLLADTRRLVSRDYLTRTLLILKDNCQQGNAVRVENLISELRSMRYGIHIDPLLKDICRPAENHNPRAMAALIDKIILSINTANAAPAQH
ncbi:hypothetical protein AGMMS50268_22620 [Spirochaetia bacterium]|nr:hypothetical protein AGMMS50268_22620 [Spirochaetia bacterium]